MFSTHFDNHFVMQVKSLYAVHFKLTQGDLPGGPVACTPIQGPGPIPGWGTRSCKTQQRSKVMRATTKDPAGPNK